MGLAEPYQSRFWVVIDSDHFFQSQYPTIGVPCLGIPGFRGAAKPFIENLVLRLKSVVEHFIHSEVNKSIKILTRIESPDEILKQTTPRGKLIWKKYQLINRTYEEMLVTISKTATMDKLFVYTYTHDQLSLTKDLANELLYRFPDKLIVLGREKEGEMRCSLRSGPQWNIAKALEKALVGIQGYGGGHEQACGAGIKKEDFARFLQNLRRELGI